MANNGENVTAAKVNNIKALRDEINSLKASLSTMSAAGEDCKETTEQLYKAEKELAAAMSVRRGEQNASATSIAGMEQQLKALQGTLRALSEEQKNSKWAQNMVTEAEELSEKLNKAKQEIGDYRNNIGRYAESIDTAFGKMGVSVKSLTGPLAATSAVTKDLGGAMKALFANPWALVIMAIVAAVKGLVSMLKQNDAAMAAIKKGLEPLQPILNFFHNIIGLIGEAIGKVVGWISEKLAGAFDWLLGILPTVANKVIDAINFITIPIRSFYRLVLEIAEGIVKTVGLIPGMGEKMDKAAQFIQKAQDKLKDGFGHINVDLKALTKSTEDNTKKTEENADAQKKAADAAKERAKAIADLKKRLDESEKSELDKLREKYEEERKLIKGNIEYERKLREQYEAKVAEIQARRTKELFDINQEYIKQSIEANFGSDSAAYSKQMSRFYKQIASGLTGIGDEKGSMDELKSLSQPDYLSSIRKDNNNVGDSGNSVWETEKDNISKAVTQLLGKNAEEFLNPKKSDGSIDWDTLDGNLLELAKAYKELLDTIEGFDKDYNDRVKADNEKRANEFLAAEEQRYKDRSKILEESEKTLNENLLNIDKKYNNEKASFWGSFFDTALNSNSIKRMNEEYEERMDAIKQQMDVYAIELAEYTLTEEMKLKLKEEYGEASQSIIDYYNEKALEAQKSYDAASLESEKTRLEQSKKLNETYRSAVSNSLGGIVSILDNVEKAWTDSVNAQVNSGKKSEEWGEKQFEAMKGIQSASAVINALLSANEAYSSLASIPYVGPALGAAAAAAALAAGIANVVLINKTKVGDSSVEGASTMTPALIDSTPYEYTRQITTAEEEDRLNRPIFVSVTDINNAQNQVKVVQEESNW